MKRLKFILLGLLVVILSGITVEAKEVSSIKDKDIIYIGDSRFVGLAYCKIDGLTGSEVIQNDGNDYWVCKSGTTLSQYRDTIEKELAEHSKEDSIIVYELGVNAITDIEDDVDFVEDLQNDGWTVYMCDILPIVDDKATSIGYSVREYHVIDANKIIYESEVPVIRFHDRCKKDYSYDTSDGLHYGSSTYRSWYNTIKAELMMDSSK